MNGRALIFGTNQQQRRLVRKELGIHDDRFAAVQLPYNWPTKARILDPSTHPPSFVNSSRHMYALSAYFYNGD